VKCLTPIEAREWLAPIGIAIADDFTVDFHKMAGGKRHAVQHRLLKGDVGPWHISEAIIAWFPNKHERMLWFSWWGSYPEGQVSFVERLRLGCGESRNLFDAPGHLFEPTPSADYDNKSPHEVDEKAVMAGLVLLVLLFEWDAVLFSNRSNDYILMSDGYVLFSSENPARIALAPTYGG
jgi:hypothetical protein